MTKLGIVSLPALLLLGTLPLYADASPPAPDFREVYDLIRQHLADVNDAELNRVAVQALVSALSPKVSFAKDSVAETGKEDLVVSKSSLFEGSIAYIRVVRVEDALNKALRQAWDQLGATNKLNGLVVDLRYADGTDYAAAAATADLFTPKQQPLLDWGQGQAHSTDKNDYIATPLAVLVNHQTSAAAEALAAALREIGAGLILGSRTAGQALMAREYPLKDGERLRIATGPVQLADGSALSTEGIKPDIAVQVPPETERIYYSDAFKDLSRPVPGGGNTTTNVAQGNNRARRPRFNEAELVRERRDGLVLDSDSGGAETEKPVVRDPVLARALDFLKGLTVLRHPHF